MAQEQANQNRDREDHAGGGFADDEALGIDRVDGGSGLVADGGLVLGMGFSHVRFLFALISLNTLIVPIVARLVVTLNSGIWGPKK